MTMNVDDDGEQCDAGGRDADIWCGRDSVCQRVSYRELVLLVLVLERDLDPKKRGDLVARDKQQLADQVGDRGLERQRVHVRIQVPLPQERGRRLRDGQ